MSEESYMIAGLGNPGDQYDQTRHNIGFAMVDAFAATAGFSLTSQKWQGVYCREKFDHKSLVLVKPQTYMNRSGESVGRLCDYFKIIPRNLLVIHDDLDLAPGRVKIVAGGGAGGHNGIRSLINHLGTTEFARIKIGIGHPRNRGDASSQPVEKFVLSRFSDEENRKMEECKELVLEAIELFLSDGVQVAMNRINGRP